MQVLWGAVICESKVQHPFNLPNSLNECGLLQDVPNPTIRNGYTFASLKGKTHLQTLGTDNENGYFYFAAFASVEYVSVTRIYFGNCEGLPFPR